MPTRVELSGLFRRKLKRLTRKYPQTANEVDKLTIQLEADQRPGDPLQGLGYEAYKVRLKNPSARKGKSGGFRVIYYVRVAEHVILLTIYTKTEQEDISADDVRTMIEAILPTLDTDENDE
jgi:mRNA-degrading endonuclease RelE of RelBE toxin-antitoxin system